MLSWSASGCHGSRGPGRGPWVGLVVLAWGLAWVSPVPAADGEWTASGSVGLETRWFVEEPAFDGAFDGLQSSVTAMPELHWRSSDRRHQVDLVVFGRLDDRDDERSHVDLREASYRYVGDRVEILAGVSRVFWGVAESRHLVDVIHQTDAVEDIDDEDKLGQPMLQWAIDRDWGRLEILALFGFRERPFPGVEGRLRPPLPVADTARFDSGAEIDGAVRWSRAVGDWDLGVHAFRGFDRHPRLDPIDDGRRLAPSYQRIQQLGLDAQYTRGAWLFKLEALARDGYGTTFGAAVGGFEYTFFQIADSTADLGVLVELLWDDRGATAPPTLYDRDTFVGVRWALQDVHSTQVLIGGLVDHDDGSTLAVFEASRRLGRQLTVELDGRFFVAVDPQGDLATLARDDFVNLRLAWHW